MHELAQSRDGWVLKLGNGEHDGIVEPWAVAKDFHGQITWWLIS
jgi:hypothetical protein